MREPNSRIFENLMRNGGIRVHRSALFDLGPGPVPDDFDFSRVDGMMLGLAIGDALGNTSEGLPPDARHAYHGEIRDYLPNHHADDRRVGLPSDDTQLAFWTLEQMIADGGFLPANVAKRFSRERVFGIGSTVRQFLKNLKAGKHLYECGPESAGNGALMRIAPMVIPHVVRGTGDLWVDTALSAMITHNDFGSNSACLAFVHMLRQLMVMKTPPVPEWWPEAYVSIARDLEGETRYRPRGGPLQGRFEGPVWKMVEKHVTAAFSRSLSVKDACSIWYSGAFLLETVPSVIYILMRHGHDPEEALIRAVNDTYDNDTTAAIVGAAVGALHGEDGLPMRWVANLVGRTGPSDDGKVFDLLRAANDTWWRQTAGTREPGPTDTPDAYRISVEEALYIARRTFRKPTPPPAFAGRFQVYDEPPAAFYGASSSEGPFWYILAPWNESTDGKLLREGHLIVISKRTGKVVFDGGAGE